MTIQFDNRIADRMEIHLPQNGVWISFLEYTGLHAPIVNTTSELEFLEQKLVGTCISTQILSANRVKVTVVGGMGQMSSVVRPKNFVDETVVDIANELLGGREQISSFSQNMSIAKLKQWQIFSDIPIGQQVTKLAREFGQYWNFDRDGKIVFENREENDIVLPSNDKIRLLKKDFDGSPTYQILDTNLPIPHPGTKYKGKVVEEVSIFVSKSETTLKLVHNSPTNQIKKILSTDFGDKRSWAYEARVVRQNDDGISGKLGGTCQILPRDSTIRGAGLDRIPICSVPGARYQVPDNIRCIVQFLSGDTKQPIISSFFSPDEDSELLVVLGEASAAQFVALSNIVNSNFEALETYLTSHFHPSGVGPTGPPTTPPPVPADVAAKYLKTE